MEVIYKKHALPDMFKMTALEQMIGVSQAK